MWQKSAVTAYCWLSCSFQTWRMLKPCRSSSWRKSSWERSCWLRVIFSLTKLVPLNWSNGLLPYSQWWPCCSAKMALTPSLLLGHPAWAQTPACGAYKLLFPFTLTTGDYEKGVDHLTNAIAVCGQPQQLLQVLQQTLPPPVFQMLLTKLPSISQVRELL